MVSRGEGRLEEIGEGVYAYVGPDYSSNSGFIVGAESVAVVDTRLAPPWADELIAQIRRVTTKPVSMIVITHHHGDHLFGNQAFPSQAVIIGHGYARRRILELGYPYLRDFASRRPEMVEEFKDVRIIPPSLTFSDTLTLFLEDREVQLKFLGIGHTQGDIVAYLPRERVLIAGDLVTRKVLPNLNDGHAGAWTGTLDRLLALDAQVVVPGHGDVGTMAEVADLKDFLAEMRQDIRKCLERGMKPQEIETAVTMARFGDWARRERLAQTVGVVVKEVQGELS